MKLKKLISAVNIALFFAFTVILALATLILPKSGFSELENRYLAESPKLSTRSWFSKEYPTDLGEYLQEHFALRTNWISLRTSLERLLGHDEVNGIYFADGRFFEASEPIDYSRIDRSVSAINSFAEGLGGRLSVMIVPTSSQIYIDRLPDYSPDPGQRRMINYVYSALSEDIRTVDVYDRLYRAREDYIYYRTDHHWTTAGAYIAYCEFARAIGYDPVALDRIDIEHARHDFLGSYYSKVISDEAEPDTVDIYSSDGAEVTSVRITAPDGSVSERDSVYFREYLDKKDKYLTFLGENVPLVEIESDAGGGSLLIIKDSYANCFAPFLTKHFSKVTLVDLRYMMSLSDYVDVSEYDRVLILYNASTFAEDANIAKLSAK